MRTRRLGQSELALTTVGLGTWAIGGPWQYGWGDQDDADSIRTILAALETGINWIDTAPIYGCGHAEYIVGQALRELSDKPLVATKCGLAWNAQREKINRLDRAAIITECEDSLRRLGVDVIDLYQLHWPVPDAQVEEAWEAMAALVDQGKVRFLGACNFTVEQLERIAAIVPAVSLQPPYSMLARGIEARQLPYCRENGMGILAYSPMQKGLLTGKFTREHMQTLAADDHRRQDRSFMGAAFERNLAMVEALKPVAARNGKTPAQLAIAWVLRDAAVTAAIVGARRPEQIDETAAAADWDLSEDDIQQIETILT